MTVTGLVIGLGLAAATVHSLEIIESLRPGQSAALTTRPDGTVLEGHHRLAVLRERGMDIDALPREVRLKEDGA